MTQFRDPRLPRGGSGPSPAAPPIVPPGTVTGRGVSPDQYRAAQRALSGAPPAARQAIIDFIEGRGIPADAMAIALINRELPPGAAPLTPPTLAPMDPGNSLGGQPGTGLTPLPGEGPAGGPDALAALMAQYRTPAPGGGDPIAVNDPTGQQPQVPTAGPGGQYSTNPDEAARQKAQEAAWAQQLAGTPPGTPPTTDTKGDPNALPGGGDTGGGNAPPGSLAGTMMDPYVGAVRGSRQPLQAVLGRVLQGLGINMDRPGLFSNDIQKEVEQYLPFYMSGADLEGASGPRARAQAYQDIVGGQHGFQKLGEDAYQRMQSMGDLGGLPVDDQQNYVMNTIAAMDSGLNPLAAQVDQAKMDRLNRMWGDANLDTPVGYIDFLRQHADEVPQAAKLREFLLRSTPSRDVQPLR